VYMFNKSRVLLFAVFLFQDQYASQNKSNEELFTSGTAFYDAVAAAKKSICLGNTQAVAYDSWSNYYQLAAAVSSANEVLLSRKDEKNLVSEERLSLSPERILLVQLSSMKKRNDSLK